MTKFMGSSDPLALIGVTFNAFKDMCQHYSGPAIVVRLKKNGLYECHGDNGVIFEERKSKIVLSVGPGNLSPDNLSEIDISEYTLNTSRGGLIITEEAMEAHAGRCHVKHEE